MGERIFEDGTNASTLRREAEKARVLGLLLNEHDRKRLETIAQRLECEALEIEIKQRLRTELHGR